MDTDSVKVSSAPILYHRNSPTGPRLTRRLSFRRLQANHSILPFPRSFSIAELSVDKSEDFQI